MNILYIIGVHKWLIETNGVSSSAIAKQFSDTVPSFPSLFGSFNFYFFANYSRSRLFNMFVLVLQLSILSILFYFFVYSGKKLLVK